MAVGLQNFSKMKRKWIRDINEASIMKNVFVQGKIETAHPVHQTKRGKLCKLVLQEDDKKSTNARKDDTVMNAFFLGKIAEECYSAKKGDVIVLTNVVVEHSTILTGHKFQLIINRDISDVSVSFISSRSGKRAVRANEHSAVSSEEEQGKKGHAKKKRTIIGSEGEDDQDSFEKENLSVVSSSGPSSEGNRNKEPHRRLGRVRLGPRGTSPSAGESAVLRNVVCLDKDTSAACSTAAKASDTEMAQQTGEAREESSCEGLSLSRGFKLQNLVVQVEKLNMFHISSSNKWPSTNQSSTSRILPTSSSHDNASVVSEEIANSQCSLTTIPGTPSGHFSPPTVRRSMKTRGTSGRSPEKTNTLASVADSVSAEDAAGQSSRPQTENKQSEENSGSPVLELLPPDYTSSQPANNNQQPAVPSGGSLDSQAASVADSVSAEDAAGPSSRPQTENNQPEENSGSPVLDLLPPDYTSSQPANNNQQPAVPSGCSLDSQAASVSGPSQIDASTSSQPSSTPDATYTVPAGYAKLAALKENSIANIYGVVKYFKPPWKSRGTDMCSVVLLMDPSLPQSNEETGFECVLFQAKVSSLPQILSIGDIVRLHRMKVSRFKGRLQAKSSKGFAAVVFDGDPDITASENTARLSSNTFTFSAEDKELVHKLKSYCVSRQDLFQANLCCTIADITPSTYFDMVCQVIAVAQHRNMDCVVLRVSDGTTLQNETRKYSDDTFQVISLQPSDVPSVDVFLFGEHAEDARHLEVNVGVFLKLHNVHAQVCQRTVGMSLLDELNPVLELCIHRGRSYGRGLNVLSGDFPEVKIVTDRLRQQPSHD